MMEGQDIKPLKTQWSTATYLAVGGGVLALLYFLIVSPEFNRKELWFMIEIAVLTVVTRTVSLRFGLGMYAQGIALSAILTLLFYGLLNQFELNTEWSGQLIMAVLEEVFKFLPVLLAAWLVYKNRKLQFTISDWLLLSVFTAAGFSMVEKSFWEGVYFPFTYGPHVGGVYFFSDALGITVNGENFGYIGHAAASGFIGMAFGIGLYLKKQAKQWWWAVPSGAFVWICLEHVLNNKYYFDGSEALLGLGGGQLTPWLFIIMMIIGLVIDYKNTKTHLQKNAELKNTLQYWKQQVIKDKKYDAAVTATKYLRLANLQGWEDSTVTTQRRN